MVLAFAAAAIAAESAAFCIARVCKYQFDTSNPRPKPPTKIGRRKAIITAMVPRWSASRLPKAWTTFARMFRGRDRLVGMSSHLSLLFRYFNHKNLTICEHRSEKHVRKICRLLTIIVPDSRSLRRYTILVAFGA